MRYLLTIILGLFLWTGCNDDDETLVPSTEPEFRSVLPQGNHDYDTKIVNWYEDCGFYILYKYEDKDVFYNENMPWAGFVQDTLRINESDLVFYNHGLVVELPDEEYVGKQLEWIEELFLNHYPKELLKKWLPKKIILAKNVANCMLLGNNETSKSVRDYYKEIANTLIFSHGDVSVNELTSSTLQKMKNELHLWMLTEKLVDDYPLEKLESFFSVTDYAKTLSADYYEEWKAEGWLGRLANSEDGAKIEDVKLYVEMIITVPREILEVNMETLMMEDFGLFRKIMMNSTYSKYAGFLHPSTDVNGNIKKKYDFITGVFKAWGVDLEAIGELYNE